MSQAELFKKMTIERPAIERELDDIIAKMVPLVRKGTRLRDLPPEFHNAVKRFAAFETQYEILRRQVVKFVCDQCDAEFDEPASKCPGCGTEMEESQAPPVAVGPGVTAPMDENDMDAFGNKYRQKTGGRLDGRPITTDARKRRARIL